MTEEKADFFHCPAYKLMISDLRTAVQKTATSLFYEEEEEDAEELEWRLVINKLTSRNDKQLPIAPAAPSKRPLELTCKLVWIQGIVVRIEELENGNMSLVINDDEADKEGAVIYEYNTVPGGDHPDIKTGAYVGALGQIWSTEPVIIKATKVMCLSDKPIHRELWRDEVTLAKAYLAGLLVPSLSV